MFQPTKQTPRKRVVLLPPKKPAAAAANPNQTTAAAAANPKQTAAAAAGNPNKASAAAGNPNKASAAAGNPNQASAAAGNPKQTAAAAAGNPNKASAAAGNPNQASAAAGNPNQASAAAGNPKSESAAAGNPNQASAAAGNPNSASAAAGNPNSAKQTPRKRVVVPSPKNPSSAAAAAANPNQSNPLTSSTSSLTLQPSSYSSSTTISEWGECSWSVKATPVEAIIPSNIPYMFCRMHEEMGSDAVPEDDIYAQLPCDLLEKRRCNLVQDNSFLLRSKRHLNPSGTVRRTIENSAASWLGRGSKRTICGKNGEVAGFMTPLLLRLKDTKGFWTADEYISLKNKDAKSAMVVLKCTNPLWNDSEKKLMEAEEKLAESFQKLFWAKEKGVKSKIEHWESAVSLHQRQVARAFEILVSERARLRELEDGIQNGGRVIEEPTIPVEENAAPPPVDDDENPFGGSNYFDKVVERRETQRAREKGKGKMV